MADMGYSAFLVTLCTLIDLNISTIIRSVLSEAMESITFTSTVIFVATADSYEFRSLSPTPIELPFYLNDNILYYYSVFRLHLRYRFFIRIPSIYGLLPPSENNELLYSLPKGSMEHFWIVIGGCALCLGAATFAALALFHTFDTARRTLVRITDRRHGAITTTFIIFVLLLAYNIFISPSFQIFWNGLASCLTIWIKLSGDLCSNIRFMNTKDSIILSYRELTPSILSYGAIVRASIKYNLNSASTLPMLVSRPRYHDILVTDTGYRVLDFLIKVDKTPKTAVIFTLLSIVAGMVLSLAIFMVPHKRYLIMTARLIQVSEQPQRMLLCSSPILCLNAIRALGSRNWLLSQFCDLISLYCAISPLVPFANSLGNRFTELQLMLKFGFGIYNESQVFSVWQFQSLPPSAASPLALRLQMAASLCVGHIRGGFRWVQLADRWKMGSWDGSNAYFSQAIVHLEKGSGDWYLLQGILVTSAVLLAWVSLLSAIFFVIPTIVQVGVFTLNIASQYQQKFFFFSKYTAFQSHIVLAAQPLTAKSLSYATIAFHSTAKAFAWIRQEGQKFYVTFDELCEILENTLFKFPAFFWVAGSRKKVVSQEDEETTPKQKREKGSPGMEDRRQTLRIDTSSPIDKVYLADSPLQSSSTLVESDECDNDIDSDDSEEAYERKFWSDDASRRKPLSMNSPEYMHALSLGLANPSLDEAMSGERPCNLPINQILEEPELEEGNAMQSTFPPSPNTPRFKHEPKIAPILVLPASFTPPPNRPRAKTWSSSSEPRLVVPKAV